MTKWGRVVGNVGRYQRCNKPLNSVTVPGLFGECNKDGVSWSLLGSVFSPINSKKSCVQIGVVLGNWDYSTFKKFAILWTIFGARMLGHGPSGIGQSVPCPRLCVRNGMVGESACHVYDKRVLKWALQRNNFRQVEYTHTCTMRCNNQRLSL